MPWFVMTLKEFAVARLKVMVKAPKFSVLKFALLICNGEDLVLNLLPKT
jgi:hypothetical protein